MRKLIFFILIGISMQGFSQIAPTKYLVKFTDKDQSPYSLFQPEDYLTQRAIERRTRQGIDMDITDIPVDPVYIQGVIATGATLIIRVKWINGIIIETNSQNVLAAITDLIYVSEIVQVNDPLSKKKSFDKFAGEESFPLKSTQLDPIYGSAFNQIDMVNGISLHENGYKGDGIVIAILDAGFTNVDTRTIFKSLWDSTQILGTYDFVDPSTNVFSDHSHGTMVLSVMGGDLPGVFLGTAPEADFWLLRTEDNNSEFIIEEYNWIAGAAFADSVGADIISSSLGYYEFDDDSTSHAWADLDGNTIPVTKGADLAASKGILVVNSAGNEGNKAWKYLIAPSDGDSVLAIGAVYADGLITSFSSYGLETDSRVKPNIVAQGGSTVLANVYADDIQTASGTSFSAPLIAGMMACLWQAKPNANNMELIHAVEQSSSKFSTPDNRYGYGIPDFSSAQLLLNVNDNHSSNNAFLVIPNPVSTDCYIQWNQSENNFESFELIDIQGRIIKNELLNNSNGVFKLSLEGYNKGIYFLRLKNSSQTQIQKIIKID